MAAPERAPAATSPAGHLTPAGRAALEAWTVSALPDADPRTGRARGPLPCCQLSCLAALIPGEVRGLSRVGCAHRCRTCAAIRPGTRTGALDTPYCPSADARDLVTVGGRGPRWTLPAEPTHATTRPVSCCSRHSSARPCLRPAQPAAAIMACGHALRRPALRRCDALDGEVGANPSALRPGGIVGDSLIAGERPRSQAPGKPIREFTWNG